MLSKQLEQCNASISLVFSLFHLNSFNSKCYLLGRVTIEMRVVSTVLLALHVFLDVKSESENHFLHFSLVIELERGGGGVGVKLS